jgi:hypothetical protein
VQKEGNFFLGNFISNFVICRGTYCSCFSYYFDAIRNKNHQQIVNLFRLQQAQLPQQLQALHQAQQLQQATPSTPTPRYPDDWYAWFLLDSIAIDHNESIWLLLHSVAAGNFNEIPKENHSKIWNNRKYGAASSNENG